MKRSRSTEKATKKNKEEWKNPIFKSLGLDTDKEKESPYWHDCRSKTVYFNYGESEYQITSRQYVLYALPTFFPLDSIKEVIDPSFDKPYNVIGFWRAHSWDHKVLVLVDSGPWIRPKGKDFDEPGAFRAVAISKDSGRSYQTSGEIIFSEIWPCLNIEGNESEPPAYSFANQEDCSERPFVYKRLDDAKTFWDNSFNPNESVITKGRFETKTTIPASLVDSLTRQKSVVEKEDWLKIAVFLSYDCERSTFNSDDFAEADALVREGFLHFSMMTTVDSYDFSNDKDGMIHIIPAFRFWKCGFYMLFARVNDTVHRFFLCKHYAGDPFLFCYNPYSDCVVVVRNRNKRLMDKQFFYIVPRELPPDDPNPRVITFDGLLDVKKKLLPSL